MTPRTPFWLAILVACYIPSFTLARTWTSKDGRKIDADFVDVDETTVTLKKSDGKVLNFKIELLDDDDRTFLRAILARRALRGGSLTEEGPAGNAFEPTNTIDKTPSGESESEAGDDDEESDSGGSAGSLSGAGSTKKKLKPESRTWTDEDGNQLTGKFVRIVGNNVVILRSGRTVTSDYWKLSADDQEYLKELLESNGSERLIPKINPATVVAGNSNPGTALPPFTPMPATAFPRPNTGIPSFPSSVPMTNFPTPATIPIPSYPTPMPTFTPPTYTPPAPTYTPPPMPTYTPTTTYAPPSTPTFTPPAYTPPNFNSPGPMVMQKQCMNCQAVLPEHITAGDSCPKCGVYFAKDDTNGKTSYSGPSFRFKRFPIRTILVIGVFLVSTVIGFFSWLVSGKKNSSD